MKKVLAIFLICSVVAAQAATINAASCSSSAVQTAVNSASVGDTVVVPTGTCAWSGLAVTVNTGITISGTNTTISSGGFQVNQSANTVRITGFIFQGQTDDVVTSGSSTSAAFRLDHNTFSNTGQSIFIEVYGNAPGLIDNNTFNGGAASEMIHNMAMGSGSTAGWTDDVTPGGANMLFIENNTFTYPATGNPAYFYGTSAVQSYYGARTAFRYNTLNMCQVDQHGTAGMIGARWWEIYNNTFVMVANANQSTYMALRAGSGVIYNNHLSGTNGATGYIDLYEEDTGYPALYQIGRGINQNLSPAYIWANDAGLNVGSGSSNVVQGRDFFVSTSQPSNMVRWELAADTSTTTYNYAPYTYPHPLQGGGTTYTLNTSSSGTGSGSFTPTSSSYTAGASFVVTITPASGSTISGTPSGCGGTWNSSSNTLSGSMPSSNCTIAAVFTTTTPSTAARYFGQPKARQRR